MPRLRTLLDYFNGDTPVDSLTSTCLHPVSFFVRDSLGVVRKMYGDCGQCVRCLDRRRNDMATRMILHDKSNGSIWRHCYFVTLTYGSYNLYPFVSHPFKKDWIKTFPCQDVCNSSGVTKWTPSVLCREHIVKYLKRLRKAVSPAKISFVYCGEYGKTYARPHFHLVVWSDTPISPEQFTSAWSLLCQRTDDKFIIKPYRGNLTDSQRKDVFRFLIGNVDVVDLVANGTKNDLCGDSSNTAKNCFQYVCKYVGKRTLDFQNRFAQIVFERRFRDIWNNRLYIDPVKGLRYKYNNIIYESLDYETFKKIHYPFVGSSLQYAIGKEYFMENAQRFLDQNFALPEYRAKKLTFPRYYANLLSQTRYPLRLAKATKSGHSFTTYRLSFIREILLELRDNPSIATMLYGSAQNYGETRPCLRPCHFDSDRLKDLYSKSCFGSYSFTPSSLISSLVFITPGNRVRFEYSNSNEMFIEYRFNRPTRGYDISGTYEIPEFVSMVVPLIDKRIAEMQQIVRNNEQLVNCVDRLRNDSSYSHSVHQFEEYRKSLQARYKVNHLDNQ